MKIKGGHIVFYHDAYSNVLFPSWETISSVELAISGFITCKQTNENLFVYMLWKWPW